MPGNIIQQGFSQQPQIQVIAAGKPFQSGQIAPQMLTTQGKPVIGNGTTGFGGYTLPTSQSQTLVFSACPVNVLSSQPQQQQQNLLPMTTVTSVS